MFILSKCTDVCNTPSVMITALIWPVIFVTWTELEKPELLQKEMKRISKKYVLIVTCNNFQPGYPGTGSCTFYSVFHDTRPGEIQSHH